MVYEMKLLLVLFFCGLQFRSTILIKQSVQQAKPYSTSTEGIHSESSYQQLHEKYEYLEKKLILLTEDVEKNKENFQQKTLVLQTQNKMLQNKLENITQLQMELQECKDTIINIQSYQNLESVDDNIPSSQVRRAINLQQLNVSDIIGKPNNVTENILEHLIKLLVRSTCHEWKQMGFIESGYYLIDPDGQGVGEPPFVVYCDMITGFAYIHHDTEVEQTATSCSGRGCYEHSITYKVTDDQIKSFKDVSDGCQQYVKIDCNDSPLAENGELLSWWEDINGLHHGYWSGSAHGQHTCSCGFSKGCLYPRHSCNCNAPIGNRWVSDEGYISNASSLPIKKVAFGSKDDNTLQIKYTIGPLRCFGHRVKDYPESCLDIARSGISSNGYYYLGKPSALKLVYCNMKHPQQDGQSQSLIEIPELQQFFDDVRENQAATKFIKQKLLYMKSRSIMFSVSSEAKHTEDSFIKFENVIMDIGENYNSSTGFYTVPITGVYLFYTNICKNYYKTATIELYQTTVESIGLSYSREFEDYRYTGTAPGTYLSVSAISDVNAGDQVAVRMTNGETCSDKRSTFFGFLLY